MTLITLVLDHDLEQENLKAAVGNGKKKNGRSYVNCARKPPKNEFDHRGTLKYPL